MHSFAWSPDGNSIAYTANQDDYGQIELYHVDGAPDAFEVAWAPCPAP